MLIHEPVKEVKLIIDDVTFIFTEPNFVYLMQPEMIGRHAMLPEFNLRVVPSVMPIIFRTVERDGYTEHEQLT